MSDRKLLLLGVLALVTIITIGLFTLEFTGEKEIFSDLVIGLIVGQPLAWVSAYITFYTMGDDHKNQNGG